MEVTHTRSTSSAKGRPKNLGFFVGICVLEEIRDLSSETLKNLTVVNFRVNIIKKRVPLIFCLKSIRESLSLTEKDLPWYLPW